MGDVEFQFILRSIYIFLTKGKSPCKKSGDVISLFGSDDGYVTVELNL